MSATSLFTTRRGEFRRIYGQLRRDRALFARTPIVFCEGDSWFATPLAMNLLDWLVWPAPEDETRGVPLFGAGGLFFRAEHSGDRALQMFDADGVRDKVDWFAAFEFDLVLLSAGGNDFVGDFLVELFADVRRAMSVDAALQRVRASGRYAAVRAALQRMIAALQATRAGVPVLAHSYDYPRRLGAPAVLSLHNVGLAALARSGLGPWIAPALAVALPAAADQREFARSLIDGYVAEVLEPLRADPVSGQVFDFVDLRGTLTREDQWADEMHPTSAGFALLAARFRRQARARLQIEV
ncbi:MAG: hypothetical protein KF903_04065 [Dokdonella sp.]|uniref:hypothetical protein n=2 Tax=Dokdonella sp. TaxID=2291710 RepID=UPI0025B9AF2F|nr:hypothetical protein [Dokdonella sp.]MBX3700156.1 hypothetical protein [Dokdonella sp.]